MKVWTRASRRRASKVTSVTAPTAPLPPGVGAPLLPAVVTVSRVFRRVPGGVAGVFATGLGAGAVLSTGAACCSTGSGGVREEPAEPAELLLVILGGTSPGGWGHCVYSPPASREPCQKPPRPRGY